MYVPRFTITNDILKNIGQIEAAREIIDNAPLVPDFEKQFQSEAIVRMVHHGTHIEGNDLDLAQTRQVLEGASIYARDRDIQEVINYRNVVRQLDNYLNSDELYSLDVLLSIHQATVDKIVPPEKSGRIRNTKVVIREESTGNIIFSPPAPLEVPYLLQDFLGWINSVTQDTMHPVIKAGIAHYVLVTIHPFVEGNGRTSRAFSTLVLLREGYDIRRFFTIEEYFDRDLNRYYDAFFQVDSQGTDIASRDLTPWLTYFTEALAVELTNIKEKVKKLSIDSRLRVKIGQQVALSARQMKLIEYISESGGTAMRELKDVLQMVSEDTILRDLKDLIKKGIVDKEGSTKAARYVIKR